MVFHRWHSKFHENCVHLPSGNLTSLWKITIFNGKIHYKWPFSIVFCMFTRGYPNVPNFKCLSVWGHPAHPNRWSLSMIFIPWRRRLKRLTLRCHRCRRYWPTAVLTTPWRLHKTKRSGGWPGCSANQYLIGGLEGFYTFFIIFYFFHILEIIIPTDELIFFRGVGIPPTRYGKHHSHWNFNGQKALDFAPRCLDRPDTVYPLVMSK